MPRSLAAQEPEGAGNMAYAYDQDDQHTARSQSAQEVRCAEDSQPAASKAQPLWRSRSQSPNSEAFTAKRKIAKFTRAKKRQRRRDIERAHGVITSSRPSDSMKNFAKNWRGKEIITARFPGERTALLSVSPISSYGTQASPSTSSSAISPGTRRSSSSPSVLLNPLGAVIARYDSGVFTPATAPCSPLDQRASVVTVWGRGVRTARGSGDEEAGVGFKIGGGRAGNEYPRDVTRWIFFTWAGWYVLLVGMAVGLCWVGSAVVRPG